MTIRGWAWGEENSTPETPESWQYWTYEGTFVTARNSGEWDNLQLLAGDNFVSPVKDLGSVGTRFLEVKYDKYSSGRGTAGTIYWRGADTYFTQDSDEILGPAWEVYTGGSVKTWRYIQLKVSG